MPEAPVQSGRHIFDMIRYRKNACTKVAFEGKKESVCHSLSFIWSEHNWY